MEQGVQRPVTPVPAGLSPQSSRGVKLARPWGELVGEDLGEPARPCHDRDTSPSLGPRFQVLS